MIIKTSEALEIVNSFDQLGINEQLLRGKCKFVINFFFWLGLYAYGFNKPSAVQQRAILPILKKRDVIVQSQSGTGKTAVFSLGALQSLEIAVREPQVLILSPTRELAEQT